MRTQTYGLHTLVSLVYGLALLPLALTHTIATLSNAHNVCVCVCVRA